MLSHYEFAVAEEFRLGTQKMFNSMQKAISFNEIAYYFMTKHLLNNPENSLSLSVLELIFAESQRDFYIELNTFSSTAISCFVHSSERSDEPLWTIISIKGEHLYDWIRITSFCSVSTSIEVSGKDMMWILVEDFYWKIICYECTDQSCQVIEINNHFYIIADALFNEHGVVVNT